MNGGADQTQMWRSRKWWVFILVVFLAQITAIFWLSERGTPPARPLRPAPVLHVRDGGSQEVLDLLDPTLFALPRPRGFSGLAWSKSPRPTLRSPDWSEPPRWLEPKPERLGADLATIAAGNIPGGPAIPPMPPAEVMVPDVVQTQLETLSRLTIHADEPVPALLTPIPLKAWPPRSTGAGDAELLTNTVVQLVIDSEGKPRSANLLSSSGSAAADNYALEQARLARFEAVPPDKTSAATVGPILSGLRWPRLVFEWETSTVTNAPASAP